MNLEMKMIDDVEWSARETLTAGSLSELVSLVDSRVHSLFGVNVLDPSVPKNAGPLSGKTKIAVRLTSEVVDAPLVLSYPVVGDIDMFAELFWDEDGHPVGPYEVTASFAWVSVEWVESLPEWSP